MLYLFELIEVQSKTKNYLKGYHGQLYYLIVLLIEISSPK